MREARGEAAMFEDKTTLSSAGMDVAVFGAADWQQADRALRSIARRAGLDAEEARWLLVARRTALHRQLGFATLAEYLERVLGYGPHAAAERLRVAEALDELPATHAALARGALSFSAVRELTRVV